MVKEIGKDYSPISTAKDDGCAPDLLDSVLMSRHTDCHYCCFVADRGGGEDEKIFHCLLP